MLAVQGVLAIPQYNGAIESRRVKSILIDPLAQPSLPDAIQAEAASASVNLNLSDIQGDILIGTKKNKELFLFFTITDVLAFKRKLGRIHDRITSTSELLSVDTQPTTAINIAFSQTGLYALGVFDNLQDDHFRNGQLGDISSLGDPGTQNWVPAFLENIVHGVLLLASDTLQNINDELANLTSTFGECIIEVHRLQGEARPGDQQGHEHFGFMDGISQPAVEGFTASPFPGQISLPAGEFLLGEPGDTTSRPTWAKDGSFLVFRQMKQRVPEFNKFLSDNALSVPSLNVEENTELLGARMMGRWKSGAPIDLSPLKLLKDDPDLGTDPMRNNNFTFAHPGEDIKNNQTRCPFAAHLRKVRPRADFGTEETVHHIIRASIPYGPEVTDAEAASSTSDNNLERGLAFVAYQSDIGKGFVFLQQQWVDNANFFFNHSIPPGVDPIIGSTNSGLAPGNAPRAINGLDPLDSSRNITINIDFVESRGGEYFFSPSISAIKNKLTAIFP